MVALPPGIGPLGRKFRARFWSAGKDVYGPARPSVAQALQDLSALRAKKPVESPPKRGLPKYVYKKQWHGKTFHRAQRKIDGIDVTGRDDFEELQM